MALTSGTRLGPYEILAPLGAGGMGEVYRARDTRLDRTVAIKILPPHLSEDPILRQRFEREAKAISSLNHPHICVLYDVGKQDGMQFLVMECVEGETLAKKLERGPLPLEQALKYGMQIADALDRAHRTGVVHRDLKPGNIMLTASGAKLLDFGLAKAAPPLAAGATLTAAATRTTPVTQQGTVVGTFQYMSPEQVEGKEVDARSDIFSFGSVLYEMVSGRRAFQGKTQLSVASAILEKDPEPISTLRPLTPPALDRTIRVCLAKDPEDRWQMARDLLLELKWIAEAGSQAGVPATVASHRKVRERLAWMVAAALLIVATLLVTSWWHTVRISPARLPVRLSAELPRGMIIDRFNGGGLAVSSDGTRVVVSESDTSGKWQLAIRWLDQGQFTPLPDTERGYTPSFSPDGQWIAFFANHKLRKMPLQGGSSVTLCDAPGFPRGTSWGDDGNIITALNTETSALARVSSAGGAPSPLTQLNKQKGETAHAWPQVLPGSQAVLFTAYRSSIGLPDDATIEVVSLKTGERKNLCSGAYFGRYLPTGHLAYLRGSTLFAAPFDLRRMEITGSAQPLLEDVNTSTWGSGDFDFSQTGTLVYVSLQGPSSHYPILWLDAAQQVKPLQVTPEIYENPLFSPDGKRLAFEVATGPMTADIWAKDLERGTMSRLTHLPGRNNHAVWTPDGKAMVFASYYRPAPGIFWIRADGAGEPQRLTDTKNFQFPSSFSPDSKQLAYSELSADSSRFEIWTAPVEGSPDHPRLGKAEPFSRASFSERHPAFSPDGHWLAYSSNESGMNELYVRPFPGPGGKTQVSTSGGGYPIWSRDRRTLFFIDSDWRIMAVEYSAKGDSFVAGKPQVWSPKHLAFLGGNYPYDLEPGSKRFAVILDPGGTEKLEERPTDSVNVLLNFFDELRRKAPTGKN